MLLCLACTTARGGESFSVLVFSKTAGYRHDSISAGVAAIRTLGASHGFQVDATEDAARFTAEGLARHEAVVFLNTTGDVLDPTGQDAFEAYIRKGGGFVGVHSATDTEYDWPWYGRLVGNYFLRHPPIQRATLDVDRSHASTAHLPVRWTRVDEWYDFRKDPDPGLTVLMRIDEATYRGARMGANHPMAWFHEFDGGRAWYTAIGHTAESYGDPLVLDHLLNGIRWAAGARAD